jgi:alanyl-tRNA synthetase
VLFKLYDTFGFPLDLTQDILRGQQLAADEAGFRAEMEAQRARSREAWKGSGDQGVAAVYGRIASDLATQFVGYDTLEHEAEIRALLVDGRLVDEAGAGREVEVVVAETPFYAESGGQVGDRGAIETAGGRVEVHDTQRPSGELVVHRGKVASGVVRSGETARLAVDRAAREATVRNHSGTHLLHAALREVLGPQAVQKGSLVSPERLRFDFTHDAPLTDEQIERIEDLVNAWIEANDAGLVRQMGYREAIDAGAIAMFTEKYGDRVRVVSFGGVSTELCGGTHARATGDIGLLQVVSQSGIAAGVRRIEAVTGLGALRWIRERDKALRRVGELLRVPPPQAPERVEKLLEERKEKEREIAELRRARHRGPAAEEAQAPPREIGGVRVLVREVEGVDGKELRELVDDLRGALQSGVVLVASRLDGRVSLALGVTNDLRGRLEAGKLVRELAAVVDGKGGGRPDFAQAGGTSPEKLPAAIERLYALVGEAAP